MKSAGWRMKCGGENIERETFRKELKCRALSREGEDLKTDGFLQHSHGIPDQG